MTNPTLDEIYEAGLSSGALGGKLLGAGGGGFMAFFVPPERREALRTRLKKLLCIPFCFSTRGSHVGYTNRRICTIKNWRMSGMRYTDRTA
jgi:D-glycero-alpha-D-manno-heptose-7-phosphate kinase